MKQKFTPIAIALALTTAACLAQDQQPPAPPAVDLSKLPPPSDKTGLTFTNDIEPLFKASCLNCHSGQRPRGGLRLDTLENALKGGSRNGETVAVIKPGDSKDSPLVVAVAQLNPRSAMPPPPRRRPGGPGGPGMGGPGGAPGDNAQPNTPPPNNGGNPPPGGGPGGPGGPGGRGPAPKPLTPEQVGLVRAWIDQGAK